MNEGLFLLRSLSFTGHCSLTILCHLSDFQVRIREIPILDKLKYLHCLLSSVLPVIKQIHHVQASEVELEKSLHGRMFVIPGVAFQCFMWVYIFYALLDHFFIPIYFQEVKCTLPGPN